MLGNAMLQKSKVMRSRDEWRLKAVQRADEIRERRKCEKRYQEKIAQLKAQLKAMEQADKGKKNN